MTKQGKCKRTAKCDLGHAFFEAFPVAIPSGVPPPTALDEVFCGK